MCLISTIVSQLSGLTVTLTTSSRSKYNRSSHFEGFHLPHSLFLRPHNFNMECHRLEGTIVKATLCIEKKSLMLHKIQNAVRRSSSRNPSCWGTVPRNYHLNWLLLFFFLFFKAIISEHRKVRYIWIILLLMQLTWSFMETLLFFFFSGWENREFSKAPWGEIGPAVQ